MNAPWDMLDVKMEATSTAAGFANYLQRPNLTPGTGWGQSFPETFTANATEATERPAWREYWVQLYDYYTVLGCEYEIIIKNPIKEMIPIEQGTAGTTGTHAYAKLSSDIQCAVQFDTYSNNATTTGNVMPLTRYSESRAFKNLKWYRIHDDGGEVTIRGTYRPGDAKRNIINDGDVQTWTKTTTTLPNLKEILTLNFWQHPFNDSQYGAVNMEINLKYIVQFKDLKLQARYPNTASDISFNLVQNLSKTITDTGNPLQRWA